MEDATALGLIPAHAGKTFAPTPKSIHGEAHPRSRGENQGAGMVFQRPDGSSPLTRGKPQELPNLLDDLGLIPAHAGKTRRGWMISGCRRAHPRSRGENASRDWPLIVARGSSPLTRGKPNDVAPPVGDGRLIPAHAGKTYTLVTGVFRW